MALSRRDFLKVGGSACIVAGAGAALAGCSPSGGSPDSPKPVSYTHLDVYKRQMLDEAKDALEEDAEGASGVTVNLV